MPTQRTCYAATYYWKMFRKRIVDGLCPLFGNATKGAIYQLTDLYTLFYLHWIKDRAVHDSTRWSNSIDSPTHRAWSGYAFEQLCLHHISGIKQRLGISGVATSVSSWVQKADKAKGLARAQIDLILDRRDQIVNHFAE